MALTPLQTTQKPTEDAQTDQAGKPSPNPSEQRMKQSHSEQNIASMQTMHQSPNISSGRFLSSANTERDSSSSASSVPGRGILVASSPPYNPPPPKLSSASTSNLLAVGRQLAGSAPKVWPQEFATPASSIACFHKQHRGELAVAEKYRYDLSRAQLKASSRTSALLAGFAMVALVELQYEESTPRPLLILLGVVTTLLVSVHLLALMMSTCLLPYIEASGCTQDSPHIKLKFYIELSWLFSTCIGLILFLLEIGVIFFVKFNAVGYDTAGYITTAMLVPVLVVFVVFSCLIHRNRFMYSVDRAKEKAEDLEKYLNEETNIAQPKVSKPSSAANFQGVTVVKNTKLP